MPRILKEESVTQDKIVFTVTASPRDDGGQVFRSSIQMMVENGVGGASFIPLQIGSRQAVLQGEMVADPRLVTERGLAEYLEDTSASKEGIHLALDVELGEHFFGWRPRAA